MTIMSQPAYLILLVIALPMALFLKRHASLILTRLPGANNEGARKNLAIRMWRGAASIITRPFRWLPNLVLAGALTSVTVALTAPQVIKHLTHDSTVQGRDIIIALDYSASMGEKFSGKVPALKKTDPFFEGAKNRLEGADSGGSASGGSTNAQENRRIDAAQAFILLFVERRLEVQSNDSIGLIAFDRSPRLCWPLDRDLKQISRHGNFVPRGSGQGGLGNGTNFGAEIPGPIDMASEHFQKHGHSQSRVLVIVSDGDNKMDEKVQARLVKVVREAGMRLYVVGVGEVIAKNEVDIIKVAKKVEGTVFKVERAEDMEKCFATIDALESSPAPVKAQMLHDELFYIPLFLGMVLFLGYLFLEATLYGK